MKKFLRIAVRAALGFVVLGLAALVVCLDTVDYRVYLREPYYQETRARLLALESTQQAAVGELEAGFGRANLTPTLNVDPEDPTQGKFRALPLAGYSSRHGVPAAGVHDPLFVKAVALRVGRKVGVMIGVDALIIPPEITDLVTERLQQESGLSRDQIYLSATHTHSSLGGWGEGWAEESSAGKFQPGVRVWFSNAIVEAVQAALRDLQPASLGRGHFAAQRFVRNRLVGELGQVDPEFDYEVIKQEKGRTAILGSFAAHATVLPAESTLFSADYPGAWERTVEQATSGMAVFLAGGVGSQGPVAGGNGFEDAERMGRALAQVLVDQLPQVPMTRSVTFGWLGLDVTLPPLNVRVSDNLRLRPWLARSLLPVRRLSFLQAFCLNDSIWVSTPCDFSGELALELKDEFKARGAFLTITSFNGDYVGYVVLPRYYHMDAYEPRGMSFFGPNVPDYFEDLIRAMSANLIDGAEKSKAGP